MSNNEKSVFWNMMSLWGMLLVVVGHSLVPPNYYDYNNWVEAIHIWIYSFHMPLFAFVSGACFVEYSLKHYEKKRFIKNKLVRILFPYCWWILLVAFLSIIFSFVAVHDRKFDLDYFWLCLSVPTKYSVISYYWFLLTLFWIFMLTPILVKFLTYKACLPFVTVVLLLLNIVNPLKDIEALCLNRFLDLLFFYWLGMVTSQYGIDKFIYKRCFVLIFLFGLSIIGNAYLRTFFFIKPVLACTGILLSGVLIRYIQVAGLELTWRISYGVYLLHGLAHRIPYILFRDIKVTWWEHLLIYTVIGVLIPVIIICVWKKLHNKSYKLLLGQ